MKTAFDHISFLKANRESVVSSYNKLSTLTFFDGCSLSTFMNEVLSYAKYWRSEKEASKSLSFALGDIVVNHSNIIGTDKVTASLTKKYNNTAAMALV